MAGLGIQQSLNNTIETGINSLTAHELFMSRYKEHYDKINTYNNVAKEYYGNRYDKKTDTFVPNYKPEEVKKIKSLKDRFNAATNIAKQDADIDKKQSEIVFNAKQNMILNGNEKYLPPFDKDNPIEIAKLGAKSNVGSTLNAWSNSLDDWFDKQEQINKMNSDQAAAKAQSKVADKLKEKARARAKRPQVAEESQPLQAQPRKGINIGK